MLCYHKLVLIEKVGRVECNRIFRVVTETEFFIMLDLYCRECAPSLNLWKSDIDFR